MKVLYVAEDGSRFSSKSKCEEYEKSITKDREVFYKELFMYDDAGRRVYLPVLARYADIRTADAMRVFFALSSEGNTPVEGIGDTGKYIFGIGDSNTWTPYETLEKWLENSMKVFILGNRPVNVTIAFDGLSVKLETDRNKTVKEVLDYAGIVMDGLKCNILMGKRGFLLTDETMNKSFCELGVVDGCTLRLREDKEWE